MKWTSKISKNEVYYNIVVASKERGARFRAKLRADPAAREENLAKRRGKVVSTDASTSGWGALLKGRPFFGQWSEREKLLYINCLEMMAVDNALRHFCPLIKGHHVLVRSDMSVVAYINRQGGIRSRNLYRLTERLLVWAQHNLRSLRAAHVPGHLNVGPDRLSRDNVPTGEWSLHPQTVQLLWKTFGRVKVDLFASQENAHCPEFFSKSRDALAHVWPRCPLYAFPPSRCYLGY
ncbi:hypothetical protein PO909_010114 [Leuciscus waleckii]